MLVNSEKRLTALRKVDYRMEENKMKIGLNSILQEYRKTNLALLYLAYVKIEM